MSYETPDDRRYLESHEWVRADGDVARVGISDFAQDELGDVVFVELPGDGDEVTQGEEFGVVESIKAVSDLYSPVNGTVSAVNDALLQGGVDEDQREDKSYGRPGENAGTEDPDDDQRTEGHAQGEHEKHQTRHAQKAAPDGV